MSVEIILTTYYISERFYYLRKSFTHKEFRIHLKFCMASILLVMFSFLLFTFVIGSRSCKKNQISFHVKNFINLAYRVVSFSYFACYVSCYHVALAAFFLRGAYYDCDYAFSNFWLLFTKTNIRM